MEKLAEYIKNGFYSYVNRERLPITSSDEHKNYNEMPSREKILICMYFYDLTHINTALGPFFPLK